MSLAEDLAGPGQGIQPTRRLFCVLAIYLQPRACLHAHHLNVNSCLYPYL